ncbi:33483_t:CDS:2 [Gigaspora margarita]|uniref:33483_t:CDS:1 n=1 Tax=Gigaspora margarita TaxID=4874 RepID=A0ABN7V889_GIGMA|nr:33483_t:CDS:2 [Gigaspora margarita]
MLAPKPLAPKPLVNNPLSSEPLTLVIHPTPLMNLTNNFSSQQRQFLTTQLQTDSLNKITSKYNELLSFNISRDQENSSLFSPIAINPTSSSVFTIPYNSTSSS